MKFQFGTLIVDTEKEPFKSEGLRAGFYSAPGTRKSYSVAACIVEPFLDAGGTVVIFEPRSEWHTLKQKYGVVVVGGPFQDIPLAVKHAKIYAEAIVVKGISMIFDFSEIDEPDLVPFTAELLQRIYTLENVTRRPILIVPEETGEYCPLSTKGKLVPPWIYDRMTGRLVKLATQGRPLGIMMVIISQRPAQLNFTVRMMCNLSLYGKFHPKDLTDIETVLSPYSKKIPNIKALARQCVSMPHGEWIAITGESATKIAITTQRKTPHGADTPTLTTTASLTQFYDEKTLQNLSDNVLQMLKQEQEEQSELQQTKNQLTKTRHDLDEANTKIKNLTQMVETIGKIKIETPQPTQQSIDVEPLKKRAEEAETKLNQIRQIINSSPHLPDDHALSVTAQDLYRIWEPKMPSLCAKRIFKFLLTNKGAKYTKSQLGVSLGYKTASGTFKGALAFLKQNKLICSDQKYLWVEWQ